jgi:hypothetical protein
MVLAVLRWEQDRFHPSARPVSKTIVNSPPPPQPETMWAGRREPPRVAEPTKEQGNGAMPEPTPEQPAVDAIAPLEPDVTTDDPPLDSAEQHNRRWFGARRHD